MPTEYTAKSIKGSRFATLLEENVTNTAKTFNELCGAFNELHDKKHFVGGDDGGIRIIMGELFGTLASLILTRTPSEMLGPAADVIAQSAVLAVARIAVEIKKARDRTTTH